MEFQGLVSDEFTPAIDELLASISNLENMSPEILHKYLQEHSKEFFDKVEGNLVDQMVNAFDANDFRYKYEFKKNISDQIVNKNEEFFLYMRAYIEVAHHIFIRFIQKINETGIKSIKIETKDFTFLALYGNLCRQAEQIYLMLMNGHPDAAVRLWRIFYEHCVVAVFLMKNNSKELVYRFRDATYKGHKKSIESYSKRHEYFDFPPLDEDFIRKTNEEFESIKQSYGNEFFENDYSWAKPFLNGKPNFGAIEEAADMGKYRPYYIQASGKVHPSFISITDFKDENGKIILDRMIKPDDSTINMINPAQLTIGCFYEVNYHFLRLYSGHEYNINLMLFEKLWKRFSETLKRNSSNNSPT